MSKQNILREEVRRLKWEEEISYKTIAEDLLSMKYNSFINWLHGYKELGSEKVNILTDFISDYTE